MLVVSTKLCSNKFTRMSNNSKIRVYREDWNLQVTQPVAGNYYPLNLGIYIADEKTELSVLVDHAVGGSSIQDGEIEIMLHRRLLVNDGRGEALDEEVCIDNNTVCEGLTARATYYMSVNQLGNGAQWRRTSGQEIYSPLLLAFAHEAEETWKASHITQKTSMDPGYSIPSNVALITLQDLDDGTVLIRLAHLYMAGEDEQLSTLAKVELRKIFASRMIKEIKETSLSANQDKSGMKTMNWRVEGDSRTSPAPVRGGPVDNSILIVELGPMEIRTFLLRF